MLSRPSIIFLIVLCAIIGVVLYASLTARDWRTASREPAGLAPLPEAERRAVVQIYGARAINWRGWFAVHTWIAVKPENASSYTIYQVMGYRVHERGRAIMEREDAPDRYWFGARPFVVETLVGDRAASAIPKIRAAVDSYDYPDVYGLWPGPNSNTFISHIVRQVPELGVELPPHAIGRDWIGRHALWGRSETKTGYQFSVFGAFGLTVGLADGIEVNILGLTFGVDVLRPALKLPFIGRVGMVDAPL